MFIINTTVLKPKMTLKSIANELGVSISTVSKALKNSDEISKETRDRIQAFAKFYNYKPNNIALSLQNRRTKNIGVIIPNIVHHYFTTVFRGIEKYANLNGYSVIVCVSDESFDREVINMEMLANGSIDGFILSLSAETQLKKDYNHLRSVMQQGIPLVLFDRVADELSCDKVTTNDMDIAYEAVMGLIASGRRNISLITTESYFTVSHSRALGYEKALRDSGIGFREELIMVLPYDQFKEEETIAFFKQNTIDAVLCVNEIFAIHCMGTVQKIGYKVPTDIAFIGFTDGLLSKYSNPTLTTVAQHGDEMGKVAAKLLIDRIESDQEESDFQTKVVKGSLIKRGSTIN